MAVLLSSCTATTGGGLQANNPSFSGVSPAAALLADAAAEKSAETEIQPTEGASTDAASAAPTAVDPSVAMSDGALPVELALVPGARPGTDGASLALAAPQPAGAAVAAPTSAEPATTETASTPQAAAPQIVAATEPQPTQFASAAPADSLVAATPAPKKKGFLASFFGQSPSDPRPGAGAGAAKAQLDIQAAPKPAIATAAPAPTPLIADEDGEETKPLIQLASVEPPIRKSANLASLGGDASALPGVRQTALFEISRKSGLDDDSDVDLHEEEEPLVQYASAAGFARLAPNGLLKQRESVDTACLKPALVRMLKTVERHYGKRMIVTSGYRSPSYNRKVRGARKSMHMYCAAADVQIPGVSKWELARYVRTMQGRGGVGTYCHTESIHIDVGPERDWNWRCRRRKA